MTSRSIGNVFNTKNGNNSTDTNTTKSEGIDLDNIQFSTPRAASLVGGSHPIKRPVSLDLNKTTNTKKPNLTIPSIMAESSDIKTPDLEKMLHLLPTPQPGKVFPTKMGAVTSEQEAFGKGFEEALSSLHNSKNSHIVVGLNDGASQTATSTNNNATTSSSNCMSGGSFTYTNLENTIAIKEEPTNVSPPVSPIDMETQEQIKLERKRQRNRVAASKCRKRKLERISKLEERVKLLKGENVELASVVKKLKDNVAQLKQQVMEHIETGCSIQNPPSGVPLLSK